MSVRSLPSPLLVVTDRHGPRALTETVAACLEGGARWVWFRDRDLPPRERSALAARLAVPVRQAGGVLSIGGDIELAASLGAGVHLGGGSNRRAITEARTGIGSPALIGVSAHSLRDIETAAGGGADYVTLSPIFATPSKPGYGPPLGPAAIREAARFGIPVIALGGITPDTAAACRAAGAAGIAIMGGAMRAIDPAGETRRCLAGFRGGEAG